MPVTLTLPDSYGLVVFAAGLGPLLTNFYMTGPVMAARKKYGVHYPNLYGVPGHRELSASHHVTLNLYSDR